MESKLRSLFRAAQRWDASEREARDARSAESEERLSAHGIDSEDVFVRRALRILRVDMEGVFMPRQRARLASLSKQEALQTVSETWNLILLLLSVRAATPPGWSRDSLFPMMRQLEQVAVWCMGHVSTTVRDEGTRMLNAIYDGTDWQARLPLEPVYARVGDAVTVHASFSTRLPPGARFYLQINAPCQVPRVEVGGSLRVVDIERDLTQVAWDMAEGREDAPFHSAAWMDSFMTLHAPHKVTQEHSDSGGGTHVELEFTFQPLLRPGFYDWRVVACVPEAMARAYAPSGTGSSPPVGDSSSPQMDEDVGMVTPRPDPGTMVLLPVPLGRGANRQSTPSPAWGRPPREHVTAGRIIAVPTSVGGNSSLHELVIDLQGATLDEQSGKLTRRGTFQDAVEALPALHSRGVRHLVVQGAIARDNGSLRPRPVEVAAAPGAAPDARDDSGGDAATAEGEADSAEGRAGGERVDLAWQRPHASPLAVVCRRTACEMVGGSAGLNALCSNAAERGIGVLVQLDVAVSASRLHRRYRPLVLHTLNAAGEIVVHRGTDGRENQWEDQVALNYRKLEAWEVMVRDAAALALRHGVRGLYLTDAQSWPLMLVPDTEELWRVDVDGEECHSELARLDADVTRGNEEGGFWTSRAAARGYPNPLLTKLAREMWAIDAHFLLVGDSHWGREGVTARSGVLPRTASLPNAAAATQGWRVAKSGHVQLLPRPLSAPVSRLQGWLRREAARVPAGAQTLLIRSTCGHSLPYPALLLGRATWPAVDLLYLLPGMPLTFQDEATGASYRLDVTNVYSHNANWLEIDVRRRKNELRAAEGIHRSAMRERERRRARRQARQRARDQWAVNAKYEAATEGGASSQSKATAAMTGQVSLSGSATPSSGASSRLVSPGGNVVVGVGDDRSPRPLTSNPGDGDRSSRESGGGQEVTAPTAAWGEMLTSEDAKPHSEGAGGADAVHSLGSAGGDGAGTPLTQDTLGGEGAAAGERSVSGTFLAEDGAVGATGSLLDARSERSSSSAEELESGGEEEEEVLVEATVPGGHTATMGREVLLPQTFWDALADEEERSPPMADPLWASGGGAFDSFDAVPEDDEDDEGDVDQEMKEEEGEGEGEGEGAKAPTREGAVGPAPDLRRLESDKVWVSKPPLQDLPRRVHHTVGAGPLDLAGAEEGGGEEGEGGKHEARLEVESGGTLPRRADQGSSGSLASRGSADSSSLDKRRSQRRGQLLAARHARSQQRSSSRRGKDVRVRSWLSLQQQGVEEGDEQVQRIRALNSEESLEDMASLEERHKALVGPQFGFDLGMIHAHYAHRAALRVRYAILRDGAATLARALHGLGEHRHVLAFVRHDPDATPTSGAHGGATVRRPTGLEAELQEAAPLAPVGSWAGVGQGDGALSQGLGVDGDDEGGLPLGEDGRGGEGAGRSPSCAALIAANFNDHPSQVLVDCAATAGAFRGGYPTSGALREALASNGTSDERARAFAHIPARAWGHGDDAAAEGTDRGGLRRLAAAECLGEMLDPGAVLAGVEVLHGSNNAGVVAGLETWPNMGDEKVAAAASFVPFIAAPWECAHGGVPLHLRPYASLCILTRTVRRSQRAPPLAVARASADCDVKETISALRAAVASTPRDDAANNSGDALLDAVFARSFARLQRELQVEKPATRLAPSRPHAPDHVIRSSLRHSHVMALLRVAVLAAEECAAAEGGDHETREARRHFYPSFTDEHVVSSHAGPAERAGGAVLGAVLHELSRRLLATDGSHTAGRVLERELGTTVRAALALACVDVDVPQHMVLGWLVALAGCAELGSVPARSLAAAVLRGNQLGRVVFVTPELGKWSTVGGLGVMVDELAQGLANLGVPVTCVSPYYDRNRKGRTDYLRPDGIRWVCNIHTDLGGESVEVGVHEGSYAGVHLLFLHHAAIFPRPYPTSTPEKTMRGLVLMAKGALEVLCQYRIIPSVVVTNDWFTGLVPAYAKSGAFGTPTVFAPTTFLHVAHNLDPTYEGRVYPNVAEGALEHVHGLPRHLFVDPYWSGPIVVNPSRCALLTADSWATVSRSYKKDLLRSSPLSPILHLTPQPFGHPNGIPTASRRARLAALTENTHEAAKAALQRKYFGVEPDLSIPMYAFVGRITEQKGVHLIVDTAEHLILRHRGRIQILVGGMASSADRYGLHCAEKMRHLSYHYPRSFWADPEAFFVDGPLVNLGADFGLMPSLFEPGGIVQQEFFVAGTPVIAFHTGGLKDTVIEFDGVRGNGLSFRMHSHEDFVLACERAAAIFADEEQYARIRRNAEASVVDLTTVARGWFCEFHRLRRLLTGPVVTMFKFHSPAVASTGVRVEVWGSFNSWQAPVAMRWDAAGAEWVAPLLLPPGLYTYKFKVDGQWALCNGFPTLMDQHGMVNHCIAVGDEAMHPTAAEDEDEEREFVPEAADETNSE